MLEVEKKKNWQLTTAAFDGLLAALDAEDRERAGAEYERIRARLIKLFEWRGVDAPEIFADETLNRTARKIAEGVRIENLSNFVGGVARNVLLESFDQRTREQKKLAAYAENEINSKPEDEDERVPCFRQCLDALPEKDGSLIVDYYNRSDDAPRIKQRKDLAAALGESPNALRIRVHRLRHELDKCIRGCLQRESEPSASNASARAGGSGQFPIEIKS